LAGRATRAGIPTTIRPSSIKPKRRALLLLGLILALDPVSYLVVSRDGFYDPGPLGLGRGPGDTMILVSKFGYKWQPFEGFFDRDDYRTAACPAQHLLPSAAGTGPDLVARRDKVVIRQSPGETEIQHRGQDRDGEGFPKCQMSRKSQAKW
jgi:hypothetical protein